MSSSSSSSSGALSSPINVAGFVRPSLHVLLLMILSQRMPAHDRHRRGAESQGFAGIGPQPLLRGACLGKDEARGGARAGHSNLQTVATFNSSGRSTGWSLLL